MKLAHTVLCSAFRNVYGRDKKINKKNAEKILGSGKKRKSAETRKMFMPENGFDWGRGTYLGLEAGM